MELENDELVSVLPVHYSDRLCPNVHIHQFPLLNRPLQVPPSATVSGKRIRARVKPVSHRIEIHVPVDARPEVWNHEKSKDLGTAQREDDREKNQEDQLKQKEGEDPRLTDSRLHSDPIPQCGAYMLGVMRDGERSKGCPDGVILADRESTGRLHLVPISEMHQFRPTLTYLDIVSRKARRSRGGGTDSESDDGPPPDPDEVLPVVTAPKKAKKTAEAKEVQVSARKSGDDKNFQGGMSAARREMLLAIRTEEDEPWRPVQFCDGEVLTLCLLGGLVLSNALHRRKIPTRLLSLYSRETRAFLNVKRRLLHI